MKRTWADKLVSWYANNKRDLPWRETSTGYHVWVSEIMLQQTQVVTVIPYYKRFLRAFPSIRSLANADTQTVLKLWEGLGYYSRARNLQKAAKQVIERPGGRMPRSFIELKTLPGIGDYTAAAIASIAYGEAVPVVDGNVLRVCTRLWGLDVDISKPKAKRDIFEQLMPVIQNQNPSDFNQGIMELGALVCSPTKPDCKACPVSKDCVAYRDGRTDELPVKAKRKATPHYQIAVGVVWKDDKLLIAKRRENKMLGGLWEFPGGKVESGEKAEQACIREVKEETDLTVQVVGKVGKVNHVYSHFKVTIHAFMCHVVDGKEKPLTSDEIRWVAVGELALYPFPTANKKLIVAIQNKNL